MDESLYVFLGEWTGKQLFACEVAFVSRAFDVAVFCDRILACLQSWT